MSCIMLCAKGWDFYTVRIFKKKKNKNWEIKDAERSKADEIVLWNMGDNTDAKDPSSLD